MAFVTVLGLKGPKILLILDDPLVILLNNLFMFKPRALSALKIKKNNVISMWSNWELT